MIFSGSFYAVLAMGASLEVGKLVTASWLYNNWKSAKLLLKAYLIIAVIILMAITSLGIFGFLSRAHIEQNASVQENSALIERINQDIVRLKATAEKADSRVKQLESTGGGADVNIQNQINTEQARIDNAYKRIQPAIDEQNKIIDGQIKILTDQVQNIDNQLATLQKYIDNKEVAKAQSMVGSKADGDWGPGTAAAVRAWQAQKENDKQQLANRIEDAGKNNSTVKAAREEIQRLRKTVDLQIEESNKLINRLREQLGKTNAADLGKEISDQQKIVKETNAEIDALTEKKFKLESTVRKLESEVGPIKYIANFIYDKQANNEILEKAVTWMILIIVLVFDPLAVLLLIAANTSLRQRMSKKDAEETNNPLEQWNRMIEEANKAVTENPEPTIIEKIVEKPVEVIKEVEKIVEKIVEKPVEVIKEVEKLVEISSPQRLVYVSQADSGKESYVHSTGQVGFGTTFPNDKYNERYFIRTDVRPSRVYEFISNHWSPVDHSVLLTQNVDIYTLHLLEQIRHNIIKFDDLTDIEKDLVNKRKSN